MQQIWPFILPLPFAKTVLYRARTRQHLHLMAEPKISIRTYDVVDFKQWQTQELLRGGLK